MNTKRNLRLMIKAEDKDYNQRWFREACIDLYLEHIRGSAVSMVETSAFYGDALSMTQNITYKQYNLKDYPDQDAVKDYIKEIFRDRYGDYYWAGMFYDDLDKLVEDLAKEKWLVEMTVTYGE